MQLDSARQLKQVLMDSILPSLTAPAHVRALGVSARPLADTVGGPATIALGIVPKKRQEFALAVRIQHRSLENSKQVETIRKQAKGEVEVRYVGRVVKRAVPWHQDRNRPLRIGGSVGHFKITAGTLGCFVRARGGDAISMLSNNHVLANENRAKKGEAILQPGRVDEGQTPADVVGVLSEFIRLKKIGANAIDAALASLKDGLAYNHRNLTGVGKLAGLGDDFLDAGSHVAKVGRTTGSTQGRVTAFEVDNVVIAYDIGNLRFDGQIEIESADSSPFSQGGDSGSLIVDADTKGVALLFAGSDVGGRNGHGLTYGNRLRSVLDSLKIDLLY